MNPEATYNLKTIRKEIILIMLPIVAENCLQMLTSFVATAMVGRLLEIDISAQGMCTKIVDLSYYLFKGAGVALVVLIAKRMARGETNASRTIFEKTAVSALVISGLLCVLFWFQAELFLSIFTDEDALIIHSAKYMRILLFCLPLWGISACISGVYQGKGDTKTPMYLAAFTNLLNVVLCWGLIFGNLGMPKLGYLGAAVSLVISRSIGGILGVLLLYSRRFGIFTLSGERETVDSVLKEVYSIGLPNAGEATVWQIASIILSRIILLYGSASFAAYQLGLQAELMTEFPAVGFSVAATSLVSRAIGLQDKTLYEIYKRELMVSCTLISVVTSSLLIFLPQVFMHLLTDNAELTAIAIPYIMVMGIAQIPQNLNKIYAGILRSAGYKTAPLKIQLIGNWVIRIPLCLLCAYGLKLPILAIWFVMAADQITKCLLFRRSVNRKTIL